MINVVFTFVLLLFSHQTTTVIGALRSESELIHQCYDFPTTDFGRSNNVRLTYGSSPKVLINVGDQAIDFTLSSVTGQSINLGDLLTQKAVLLLWGHWTCPAFQGFHSDATFTGSSYHDENDLIELYDNKYLTIVHLIGPEPHPIWPFTNFDSGTLRMNYWSTIKQPQTYEERMVWSVPKVVQLLHKDIVVIAEPLDGVESNPSPNTIPMTTNSNSNNPLWCTYANGARSAILISQDGMVLATQPWFDRVALETIIQRELIESTPSTVVLPSEL